MVTKADISKGYKQTEVGIIPEDWVLISLSDIADVRDGTHDSPRYVKSGVKFITSKNIIDGKLDFSDISYISETDAFNIDKRSKVDEGDILLSMIGTIGDAVLIDFEPDFCIKNVALIKPRHTKVCSHYLFQLIYSDLYQSYISGKLDGGIQKFISLGALRNLQVPLPNSFNEQQAIAEALSDVDGLIRSLDELIAKKRQIKQGTMQQLLTPKDSWIEKRLGDTAILKARIGWQGLTTAEYLNSGDYYLVTGTEFKNGYIDWDNCHYVEELRYRQDRNIQLRERDVLVTKDGTIGKVALITLIEKPATLNSGVFVIRPIENAFHPEFFYFLLCSNIFDDFLAQLSAGSTINHLYQKDFVNFTYKTPETNEEQKEIAQILKDMDTEIEVLEQKRDKYKAIKQGMMQKLLTGRIRLV